MRPSPIRTPLAKLRVFLELRQMDMAALCECSTHLIQSYELAKKPMSESLAMRASIATGVSLEWLLAGDPTRPIIDSNRRPYSKEAFETTQANARLTNKSSYPDIPDEFMMPEEIDALQFAMSMTMKMLNRARRNGKVALWSWKIRKALTDVDNEWKGARTTKDDVPQRIQFDRKARRPVAVFGPPIEKFVAETWAAIEKAKK